MTKRAINPDDLSPREDWPAEHPRKVEALFTELTARSDSRVVTLDWGTGHLLATKAA